MISNIFKFKISQSLLKIIAITVIRYTYLCHADDDLAEPWVQPSLLFEPGGYGFAQSFQEQSPKLQERQYHGCASRSRNIIVYSPCFGLKLIRISTKCSIDGQNAVQNGLLMYHCVVDWFRGCVSFLERKRAEKRRRSEEGEDVGKWGFFIGFE